MKTNYLFILFTILLLTSCAPQNATYTTVDEDWRDEPRTSTRTQNRPPQQQPATPPAPQKPIVNDYPDELNTAKDASYMSERERQMIAEVNLVRSDPQGYIKYLEPYRRRQQSRIKHPPTRGKEMAAIDELITYLEGCKPLNLLKPHQTLQKTATKHIKYLRMNETIAHIGAGGSQPWDRIMTDNPEFTDGNENLGGGPESVRDIVIILLVDRDIPSKGHRTVLMQEDWEYLGCASVKQVGPMTNFWVQNYAKTTL